MTLGAARWHVIAESNFAWEREALDWLRSQLPDRDPWHVWTNFEFIDDEGKVSEVDALVLSPAGLFLVEIKSRPGVLTGDAHSWTWTTDGRSTTVDNPRHPREPQGQAPGQPAARQPAITKAKIRLPFVEPAIFLSSTSLSCRLEGLAKTATFQRGRPGTLDDPGIVGALANGTQLEMLVGQLVLRLSDLMKSVGRLAGTNQPCARMGTPSTSSAQIVVQG